jgi:RES domain-containing protein
VASDPQEFNLFEAFGSNDPISRSAEIVAFRYCDHDVPFWARPNTRSGRWHLAGTEATQYWSLTPDGAWAELIRLEELTSEVELKRVRMPIWVCFVPSTGIADLRQEEVRRSFGLSEEDLVSDDWQACQRAAGELRQRYRGVLAPNAALEGATNLTLFGPRRMVDLEDRLALASAVRAAKVAIGRPPSELLSRVIRRRDYPTLF